MSCIQFPSHQPFSAVTSSIHFIGGLGNCYSTSHCVTSRFDVNDKTAATEVQNDIGHVIQNAVIHLGNVMLTRYHLNIANVRPHAEKMALSSDRS
jgi:hypothetical protein